MSDSLDTTVARLHELIVSARAENHGISTDPYLSALTLWVSVIPAVREVLSTLQVHDVTLGEVEYLFRESVTDWLRGAVPYSAVDDDPDAAELLADDELEHRLRTALDPPADWIF